MVPGSVWGEDVILSDRRLQQIAHTTALTFVQVLSLSKEQLDSRGFGLGVFDFRRVGECCWDSAAAAAEEK